MALQQIKTIIIDDEKLARNLIKSYLEDHPDFVITAECENGFEGLKAINETKPDLVFLDVKMPKISGFEMLELVENNPVIIFSTAYDNYAIKAFELNATDYLLKPYSKKRFEEALLKAKEKFASQESQKEKIDNLIKYSQNQTEILERLVVKLGSKIHILPVKEIRYFEAQDDYVRIYTNDGKYLKKITMKYLESRLLKNEFLRIHRSYLVAIKEIFKLEAYGKNSHLVILKDNTPLPVSRNGLGKLKEELKF